MGVMPAASSATFSCVSSDVIVFDFDDFRLLVLLDEADDDAVGFVGVVGPVDLASGGGAGLFELFEISIETAEYLLFDLPCGFAQVFPVGELGDYFGAFVADDVGGAAHVAAELRVGEEGFGGFGEGGGLGGLTYADAHEMPRETVRWDRRFRLSHLTGMG